MQRTRAKVSFEYFSDDLFSKSLIYQECLHQFGEFPYIKFSSPASIYTLCSLALDNPSSGRTKKPRFL